MPNTFVWVLSVFGYHTETDQSCSRFSSVTRRRKSRRKRRFQTKTGLRSLVLRVLAMTLVPILISKRQLSSFLSNKKVLYSNVLGYRGAGILGKERMNCRLYRAVPRNVSNSIRDIGSGFSSITFSLVVARYNRMPFRP